MDRSPTLVVPATPVGRGRARELLDAFASAHALPRTDTWPFHVALDEIFSNILAHGRPAAGGTPQVEIRLRLGVDDLEMVILDDAAAFNPLEVPRPDTTLPAEDREPGRLGIEIVRGLMDTLEYEREDDRLNRLTLRRRLSVA